MTWTDNWRRGVDLSPEARALEAALEIVEATLANLLDQAEAQGACKLALALGYTTGHGDSVGSVVDECWRTQTELEQAAEARGETP